MSTGAAGALAGRSGLGSAGTASWCRRGSARGGGEGVSRSVSRGGAGDGK